MYLACLIQLLVSAPVICCFSLALKDLLLACCTQVLVLLPQAPQNAIILQCKALTFSCLPSLPPLNLAPDSMASLASNLLKRAGCTFTPHADTGLPVSFSPNLAWGFEVRQSSSI